MANDAADDTNLLAGSTVTDQSRLQVFGPAASISSLEEITRLIEGHAASPRLRVQAAAFGLVLAASQAVGKTKSHLDAKRVVDEVAKAKACIDIAAWHSLEVVSTTAAVLFACQQFLDEQTIACTEWPMPAEVAECVMNAACDAIAA